MTSLCRPNDALGDVERHGPVAAVDGRRVRARDARHCAVFDAPVRVRRRRQRARCGSTSSARSSTRSRCAGPHGGYLTPGAGDWSDFSTAFLQMTESTLVSAQPAYVYPRAGRARRPARRPRLRRDAARAPAPATGRSTRREWTGARLVLARATRATARSAAARSSASRSRGRILAGRAARPRRPARSCATSAATSPASARPPRRAVPRGSAPPSRPRPTTRGVTERSSPVATATGDNNAVFVGGSWYAVNGWLTWALGELGGIVPGARELRLRRAAAQHASRPRHAPTRATGAGRSPSTTPAARTTRPTRRAAASGSRRLHAARSCTSPRGPLRHDQARRNRAHHARLPDPAAPSAAAGSRSGCRERVWRTPPPAPAATW